MKITRRITHFTLLLILSQQTFGQVNKNLNRRTTEKFDINKLNRLKAENKSEAILANGSIVKYYESPTEIQEITKTLDSNFSTVKTYFKSNLSLKREAHYFSGMELGKMQEYNVFGKLIYEVDYEAIFKFSLKDVGEFLLKNYNIYIFESKNFSIRRVFGNNRIPYYQIDIITGQRMHSINLNGITGEIINEGNEYPSD